MKTNQKPLQFTENQIVSLLDQQNNLIRSYSQIPALKGLIYESKGINNSEFGYYASSGYIVLYVVKILKQLKANNICDLGCGIGLFLAQLQLLLPDLNVLGLDNEKELLKYAVVFPTKYMDLLHIDGSKNIIKNYNVFYMWEPIKDIGKAKLFVERLIDALKPGDKIIYNQAGDIGRHLIKSEKFKRVDGFKYYQCPEKPSYDNDYFRIEDMNLQLFEFK